VNKSPTNRHLSARHGDPGVCRGFKNLAHCGQRYLQCVPAQTRFVRLVVALSIAVQMAGLLLLLCVPGCAVVQLIPQLRTQPNDLHFAMALGITATFGYFLFFLFRVSLTAARALSVCVFLAGATVLLWRITRFKPVSIRTAIATLPHKQFFGDVVLTFASALLVMMSMILYGRYNTPIELARMRWVPYLPMDNALPQLHAWRIENRSLAEPLIDEWMSSDRPPLQTGIHLMTWFVPGRGDSRGYQLVSTLLQASVLASLRAFLQSCAFSRRTSAWTTLGVAFTGTFVVNTGYVWPKLIAGAFTISTLTFLVRWWKDPTVASLALAGWCATLALLSHGGAMFMFLPIAVFAVFIGPNVWWRLREAGLLRSSISVIGIAAGMLAPWSIYTRLVAPPGNRLLKWHLAGVTEVDNRSTWQTLLDVYSATPRDQLLRYKWENVAVLFDPQRLIGDVFGFVGDTDERALIRATDFYRVLNPVAVVLPVLVIAAIIRLGSRQVDASGPWRSIGLLSVLLTGTVALWCVLMFVPRATVPFTGSSAMMILLLVLPVLLADQWWRYGAMVCAGWLAVRALPVWLFARPIHEATVSASSVAAVGIVACVAVLFAETTLRASDRVAV
jgi:hypothetical protein